MNKKKSLEWENMKVIPIFKEAMQELKYEGKHKTYRDLQIELVKSWKNEKKQFKMPKF